MPPGLVITRHKGGAMKPGVTILRNGNGIPHIQAETREDMYWGQGYVHAWDRGLQLLMMRILGQGRVCECLEDSDDSLAIDMFFRRMDWCAGDTALVDSMSETHRRYLDAYTDGINAALGKRIPWEFKLLGYKPEPWRREDSVLMSRMLGYLTLSQSQAEIERLIVEMIQAGVDHERLEALFPGQLQGLDMDLIKQVHITERIVPPEVLWNTAAPRMMASNNWVIAGSKTASGMPIVANDPHLETNRLPNVWCELSLHAGDEWAVGGSMPGFPGILSGRTRHCAWGVTYAFMDTVDSWVERCRDGCFYRQESESWIPFRTREETIIRKKHEPAVVTFYENQHGVLDGDPKEEGYLLNTRWSADRSGAVTLAAIFDIWNVKTTEEIMDLVGRIETSWSFVIADTKGDIGFQMSGLMPNRPEGVSGLIPLPGWIGENDWKGFADHRDLPRSLNPETGFFVTANHDLNAYGNRQPINIPMGPYRAERIADILSAGDNFTIEDMKRMHYDVESTQAAQFMAIIGPLLDGMDSPAADILRNWNLRYDAASKGAAVFENVYRELHREVFGKNGFGTDLVDYLGEETGIFIDFYLAFDRVLLSETSPWFVDRSREEIYRSALDSAVQMPLREWGRLRQFPMSHILFGGKLPRMLGFDRGPVTGIGSRATIHQGQIYRSAGRMTTFFPSFRIISDLSESASETNLSGGPSDRRFSKWYVSDLDNWLNGTYKRLGPEIDGPSSPL